MQFKAPVQRCAFCIRCFPCTDNSWTIYHWSHHIQFFIRKCELWITLSIFQKGTFTRHSIQGVLYTVQSALHCQVAVCMMLAWAARKGERFHWFDGWVHAVERQCWRTLCRRVGEGWIFYSVPRHLMEQGKTSRQQADETPVSCAATLWHNSGWVN